LKGSGYCLHSNRKLKEFDRHGDRGSQFEFIEKTYLKALNSGQQALCSNTEKKDYPWKVINHGLQLNKYENSGKENVPVVPYPFNQRHNRAGYVIQAAGEI
jgi:hypothetical protein